MMHEEPEEFNLPIGKAVGKNYQVIEFLGKGWEGEVYKIEEVRTGIIRAAKLFYKRQSPIRYPHIAYAKKLHLFRHCPVIIRFHHLDTMVIRGESVDYLISDFIDGQVLSSFVKNYPGQRLPLFEAMHLFYALVRGVEQIHFMNEYHGDIHFDNVMVRKRGLGFEVHLIDFLHLGQGSRQKIQIDVYDLIQTLYLLLGGTTHYAKLPQNIKYLLCGRKKQLIKQRFQNAGHLRIYLDNLKWG